MRKTRLTLLLAFALGITMSGCDLDSKALLTQSSSHEGELTIIGHYGYPINLDELYNKGRAEPDRREVMDIEVVPATLAAKVPIGLDIGVDCQQEGEGTLEIFFRINDTPNLERAILECHVTYITRSVNEIVNLSEYFREEGSGRTPVTFSVTPASMVVAVLRTGDVMFRCLERGTGTLTVEFAPGAVPSEQKYLLECLPPVPIRPLLREAYDLDRLFWTSGMLDVIAIAVVPGDLAKEVLISASEALAQSPTRLPVLTAVSAQSGHVGVECERVGEGTLRVFFSESDLPHSSDYRLICRRHDQGGGS